MPRPECKNVTSSQRFDGGFLSSGIVFAGFENLEMMFYIPFFILSAKHLKKTLLHRDFPWCLIQCCDSSVCLVSAKVPQRANGSSTTPLTSEMFCIWRCESQMQQGRTAEVETSPRAPGALITTAHSTLRAAANILVKRKLLAYALHTGQSICLDSVLKRQAITAIDHLQRYQLPSTDSIHITTTYFELAWLSLI